MKIINGQEWNDMIRRYGKSTFSQYEIDVIKKIKDIVKFSNSDNSVYAETPTSNIGIIKLNDDWFLAYMPSDEYYLCDQFEELLGLLKNNFLI